MKFEINKNNLTYWAVTIVGLFFSAIIANNFTKCSGCPKEMFFFNNTALYLGSPFIVYLMLAIVKGNRSMIKWGGFIMLLLTLPVLGSSDPFTILLPQPLFLVLIISFVVGMLNNNRKNGLRHEEMKEGEIVFYNNKNNLNK